MSDIIQDTKARMSKSIDNLSRELANISAGRANSNLLSGVTVWLLWCTNTSSTISEHQCA